MFRFSVLLSIIFILLISSCTSETKLKAKRLHSIQWKAFISREVYDPTIKGFGCDSLNIKAVLAGDRMKQILVFLGNYPLDTVLLPSASIPAHAENDVIISDYNFDGFCEFVIPDKKSAARGGMDYYYFIYDTLNRNFVENTSLPKFIGSFKLDIKNQRVKIYCPDDACFAYYIYENKAFKLVQGEFK